MADLMDLQTVEYNTAIISSPMAVCYQIKSNQSLLPKYCKVPVIYKWHKTSVEYNNDRGPRLKYALIGTHRQKRRVHNA